MARIIALIVMSDIPTPKNAAVNDGGLMKFGSAPYGFGVSGILERSTPDMIVIVLASSSIFYVFSSRMIQTGLGISRCAFKMA